MKKDKEIILFGYSGHAFVAAEVLLLAGYSLKGYLDTKQQTLNPFGLPYLGIENDESIMSGFITYGFFPSIGNNTIRRKIYEQFAAKGFSFIQAIHPKANVSSLVTIGPASLICQGANINPLVGLGKGVIINTGAVVEHECVIGDFAHVAPGAVLAGNVKVGENSFIGANAVIKQGVRIGNNVMVGAGAVVLHDLNDNQTYFGNPAKKYMK